MRINSSEIEKGNQRKEKQKKRRQQSFPLLLKYKPLVEKFLKLLSKPRDITAPCAVIINQRFCRKGDWEKIFLTIIQNSTFKIQ